MPDRPDLAASQNDFRSHLAAAHDLLAALLGRVKEILDADTVAVLLLDSSGHQLIATAASGLEEEVRQGVDPRRRGFRWPDRRRAAAGHPGSR